MGSFNRVVHRQQGMVCRHFASQMHTTDPSAHVSSSSAEHASQGATPVQVSKPVHKVGMSKGSVGYRPEDLVPRLAFLIPQVQQCKEMDVNSLPWVQSSRVFFEQWEKITPVMDKYHDFVATHQLGLGLGKGVKKDLFTVKEARAGRLMGEKATVAIGEFYLACALQLRPDEIEQAGMDNKALMQVARSCAEQDVEPLIEQAVELCSDYDQNLHKALEDTSAWYEVDEGLFWHANFEVVAPAEFQHYLTALGHGSGQGWMPTEHKSRSKDVDRQVTSAQDALHSGLPNSEPARRASLLIYQKWLAACSMPVKASILRALQENGFIVGSALHEGCLLPKPLSEAIQFMQK